MGVLDQILGEHNPAPDQVTRTDGQPTGVIRVRDQEVVFYQRKTDIPGLPSPVKRDARGRVLPGQTLNPRGQLPSLRPLIEALTGDFEELVIGHVRQARGEPRVIVDPVTGAEHTQIPTIKESFEARQALLDRGLGKALEQVAAHVHATSTPQEAAALDRLTPDELRLALALKRKMTPDVVDAEVVEAEALPPQGK